MTVGTVYVLANSIAPNLVAVGKTTEDSQSAANRMTQSFGASVPFMVVYEAEVGDIDEAEGFVQDWLRDRGYKIVDARGLFLAPIRDAVAALVALQMTLGTVAVSVDATLDNGERPTDLVDHDEDSLLPPDEWLETLETANELYYGSDEKLENPRRAAEFYRLAADQGSLEAYHRLGAMYREGDGVKQNQSKAFDILVEGANLGSVGCYVTLADIYLQANDAVNASKCVSLFLRGVKNPHAQLAPKMNLVYIEFTGVLHRHLMFFRSLKSTELRELVALRSDLLPHIDRVTNEFRQRGEDSISMAVVRDSLALRAWLTSLPS